jgi:D-alanine-D-alanine ligase-like ATP-grasp enzyme
VAAARPPTVLLLVPGTSYRVDDLLRAAGALGVEPIVAGDALPVLQGGEERVIQVALDDAERALDRLIEVARRRAVAAVLGFDDATVRLAARLAAALEIPHVPEQAVAAALDKAATRPALAAAGVPQPPFAVVQAPPDLAAVRRAAERVGFPCVLKPASANASLGVVRASRGEEVPWALGRLRSAVHTARGSEPTVVVERYVEGPEVALECLATARAFIVLAAFDKPDPLSGPFFEEGIYVTPSRLGRDALLAGARLASDAARALGLELGPLHVELRLPPEGPPALLEVNPRPIGGRCSRALAIACGAGVTGALLERLVIAAALGRPVEPMLAGFTRIGILRGLKRRVVVCSPPRPAGVLMLHAPQRGTLLGVDGLEAARRVPGIVDIELTTARGTSVAPVPESDRYLGFAFAAASTAEHTERALREARRLVRVRVARQAPHAVRSAPA